MNDKLVPMFGLSAKQMIDVHDYVRRYELTNDFITLIHQYGEELCPDILEKSEDEIAWFAGECTRFFIKTEDSETPFCQMVQETIATVYDRYMEDDGE